MNIKSLKQIVLTVICLLGIGSATAWSQSIHVKGTVLDENGAGFIGAGVVQKGTTNGTMTDANGNFEINVPQGAILQFSFISYVPQELPATQNMKVTLVPDTQTIEETIVIGYGVQKKSVVTAAISSITADDLKIQSQTRVDNMLQGMSSGVLVTQGSGSPDAGAQVRVRGVGTIHNSDPLYIVDGMPAGSIDFINPNDIERIEVLKDAASGAVYGARAANGVILVTTKKGKEGKTHVSYDFSYGLQNPWRKPAVLNATEYAIMMNEGMLNDGKAPIYDDPYSLGEGTDWVDAIFDKNSPIVKHDVNVSGGNGKVDYSISGGYLSNKGTIGGSFGRSYYNRVTLRENVGVVIFDKTEERNWLNKLTFRNQISYAHIRSASISTNSEYGSPLGSALGMSPLDPIYADAQAEEKYKTLYPEGYPYIIRNSAGVPYFIADAGVYNEQANPIAMLDMPGGRSSSDKIVAGLNTELNLFDGLKFRNSVSLDLAYVYGHSYSKEYFLTSKSYKYDTITEKETYDKDGNVSVTEKINYGSSASQTMDRYYTWQVENVLAYDKTFGRHTVNAVLGQSALRSTSANLGASANGLMYPYDTWKITVNNTLGKQENGDRNGWGSWNSIPYSLISYFGRVSYNFDERYMAEVTVRRDASSRFGPSNKWGTFPSFSLGWNAKNESFLKNIHWLSTAKLRGSWGINGNDNIGDFTYAVYSSSGNNYVFGAGGNGSEMISTGVKPSGLANPNVKWEQSIQTDLGVDLGFFGNKLTATIDYYNKKTSGMLLSMPVPAYAGDSAPTGNLGDMVNSGVEIDLGYRGHISDFNYGVKLNASYNHNELTYLGDDATFIGCSSHKLGTLTRGEVGKPFPFFYGWKTDGVFQNAAEVAAYTNSEGSLLQPNAQAGDFRFVDVNGDGVINDDDRTKIGKGIPDWTLGLSLNLEWKGFDFSMLLQGQFGVQAFNVSRRTDLYYINLPKNILNRWTGEGATNSYPRFAFSSANENYRASDYWIEDASFVRARNMQFGYTLPAKLTKHVAISRLRLYVQAENLFTLTKYTGCDPEVTGGNSGYGTEVGIDRGVYPQNRTFTFGVNVNF